MAASYYPTALGNTNAYRGIPNDESGIIVSSIKHTFTPKNDVLEDKDGMVVGTARKIDVHRKIDVTGIINSNGGNAAAAAVNSGLGNSNITFTAGFTVAGRRDYHGFTANHPIFVEDISLDEGQNAWKGVSLSFISYIGITA